MRKYKIYNKDGTKGGESPIHMGLILLGRIEWFVIIAVLDGGLNPQGICCVYCFNLPHALKNGGSDWWAQWRTASFALLNQNVMVISG